MFRGKESSNRIELSRLVQDLLNFGVLGSHRLWGWGGGWKWVGVVGGAPHTCAHAHMRTHAHARVLNMIISCKWLPLLGESLGIPYDVICACVCMRACVYVCGGHPLTTPIPIHRPPPPGGDPHNQSKFNRLELIEIFQFI